MLLLMKTHDPTSTRVPFNRLVCFLGFLPSRHVQTSEKAIVATPCNQLWLGNYTFVVCCNEALKEQFIC